MLNVAGVSVTPDALASILVLCCFFCFTVVATARSDGKTGYRDGA